MLWAIVLFGGTPLASVHFVDKKLVLTLVVRSIGFIMLKTNVASPLTSYSNAQANRKAVERAQRGLIAIH